MNNNYDAIIINPGHGGIDLGFESGTNYEKDFNLELSKYIYNKLLEMGYPVYLTRNDDSTISNYDRYELINSILEDNNFRALIFSIQLDNENPLGVSIIRSVNSDVVANKELYNKLNDISEVKVKTLPNDESRDYYAIQRVVSADNEVIVFEFGYDNLNDSASEIEDLANKIVDAIISFSNNINFNNVGNENYVIQKGDNLYQIARRYNTTVDKLKKINSLGTDFLSIGQILRVPKLKDNIYVVKKGDSLYSIAKKFNTDVDKIKNINNLISNKLVVNQKLLIPN